MAFDKNAGWLSKKTKRSTIFSLDEVVETLGHVKILQWLIKKIEVQKIFHRQKFSTGRLYKIGTVVEESKHTVTTSQSINQP